MFQPLRFFDFIQRRVQRFLLETVEKVNQSVFVEAAEYPVDVATLRDAHLVKIVGVRQVFQKLLRHALDIRC